MLNNPLWSENLQVKKVKVGEIEIAYYTRGNGKPLFMINGFKATMSMWDPLLLNLLEKDHLLVLFDNRGAGLSTDTEKNATSIQQMADDTAGLINALGYNSAYVLGWSMGAKIAQQLAIRHPNVIEKAILCSPNPGGKHQSTPDPHAIEKLANPNLPKDQELGLFFPSTPEGINAGKAFEQRLKEAIANGSIPDDLQVSPRTIDRQKLAAGVLWNKLDSNYDSLANFQAPVLITQGKQDVINPPENAKITANKIPFAWLAYFDGGHMFMSQQGEKFAKLVKVFLD